MLRAGTGRVKPSLPPACPPAVLASAAWNPWGPIGPSRQPDGQQRQERRRRSSGNRPQGTPGQGGEGKRGREGGERMAVWYGSPTGRAEKAGPFFFSQAGGTRLPPGFGAVGSSGHRPLCSAGLRLGASSWRETLPSAGSCSSFFFLNKVESE